MSDAAQTALVAPRLPALSMLQGQKKLIPMIAIAAAVALIAAVWLWGKSPEYKVLFSNVNDRDGGEIIGVLTQMNVPYQFSEGSGAILVPAEKVHEARLKLASQGLPKGGAVGFELMENQKLGVSQFVEQINYQRSLEGELARSMQAISAVQTARVHIAMTKQSVFVRDQQKPSASVLLNLYPGRSLEAAQVNAIVHLVSSSIPDLPVANITVLDQNGNLLSKTPDARDENGLDPGQLKYVKEYEQAVARRIESILLPIVGTDNVRAEVNADIDFSRQEQAAELYKPNQTPTDIAIRSQQISESTTPGGGSGGVPGALSNQPPAPATAPLVQAPGGTPGAAGAATTAQRRDATTNYEVDKTIRYTQQPMGGVKRVSAAVVVNHKKTTDAKGKVSWKPLSATEKSQIEALVKEAMGFNATRGDTLNVANSKFTEDVLDVPPAIPVWKQPENIQLAQNGGKYLLMALASLFLYLKIIRPMLNRLNAPPPDAPDLVEDITVNDAGESVVSHHARLPALTHEHRLLTAKNMAQQDPKAVASVVKNWVNGNE
ncbi:MAG: flagellar basal-body MS-ring/collar protein FliF [Thiobacillus sp.]